jgi:hypothetical protein
VRQILLRVVSCSIMTDLGPIQEQTERIWARRGFLAFFCYAEAKDLPPLADETSFAGVNV